MARALVRIAEHVSEREGEETENNAYLDIFKVILDECIDELNILETMFKQQHLETQWVVYESLAARFASGEREKRERQQYRIDDVYTDSHKLQKDVSLVIDILTDAVSNNLQDSNISLRDFQVVVESLEMMKEDDIRLLEDEQINQKKMNELKNQYIKVHEENRQQLNDVDTRLYFLKFECDRISTQLTQEMKYILQWEDSRVEQHQIKLQNIEDGYKNTIIKMEDNQRCERRCHSEIVKYLEASQLTYKEEIDYWMAKYEADEEQYTNDILRLNIKLQQLTEEHENLNTTYVIHAEEMAMWLEYKQEKAIQMWQYKMKIKAAEKLQAWWRETMMRCFLGPYRKKKKKGKGKNKKDKKKKGKDTEG